MIKPSKTIRRILRKRELENIKNFDGAKYIEQYAKVRNQKYMKNLIGDLAKTPSICEDLRKAGY